MRPLLLSLVVFVSLLAPTAAAQEAPPVALDPGGSFFDDDGSVHESAIEGLVAEGITSGCDVGPPALYCGDASITRSQMAAFIVRGFALEAAEPVVDPDSGLPC